jgi:hypothetical protein
MSSLRSDALAMGGRREASSFPIYAEGKGAMAKRGCVRMEEKCWRGPGPHANQPSAAAELELLKPMFSERERERLPGIKLNLCVR